MSRAKAIGLTLLFGLLSVIIVTAVTVIGFIVTFISAVLTPVLMVFTGLWAIWFIATEHDDDKDPED